MAVFEVSYGADGKKKCCRRCPPESGGCGLVACAETLDDAKRNFRNLDLAQKLEAIREKKKRGPISYQEHRLLQYSKPMRCSSC